ncbi:unnamed protein product [Diatraea saccharalis]|uniref:Uncharacterized protein n=1 Tax=Diatraea saccharalis TaxID=40085 RepID=A0A9N9QUE8_9NEOP|nr:unnamed protein product [Diatraea saccharalis]
MIEVNTSDSHSPENPKVEDPSTSSNPVKKVQNKLKSHVPCCQYCLEIIFVIISILTLAALVLIITAVLQSVIVGIAVRKTSRDNRILEESLRESFDLARQENPRHAQLWAAIQHDSVESPRCCPTECSHLLLSHIRSIAIRPGAGAGQANVQDEQSLLY